MPVHASRSLTIGSCRWLFWQNCSKMKISNKGSPKWVQFRHFPPDFSTIMIYQVAIWEAKWFENNPSLMRTPLRKLHNEWGKRDLEAALGTGCEGDAVTGPLCSPQGFTSTFHFLHYHNWLKSNSKERQISPRNEASSNETSKFQVVIGATFKLKPMLDVGCTHCGHTLLFLHCTIFYCLYMMVPRVQVFMCTVLPFDREGCQHWLLWNKFQQRQHLVGVLYLFDPTYIGPRWRVNRQKSWAHLKTFAPQIKTFAPR